MFETFEGVEEKKKDLDGAVQLHNLRALRVRWWRRARAGRSSRSSKKKKKLNK